MQRICVFCGSSPGALPEYRQAAERLGQVLIERQLGLVYGGARVGLMGQLAETVHNAGGEVIGVIPAALVEKEVAFKELPDLRVVDTMHARKALMAELADGFLALPGGLGTLEEFLEVLTWGQLGMHAKPCGILNVNRYFDHLLAFMDRSVEDTFVREEHRAMLLVHEDPAQLLNLFDTYQPPTLDKAHWILSINNL